MGHVPSPSQCNWLANEWLYSENRLTELKKGNVIHSGCSMWLITKREKLFVCHKHLLYMTETVQMQILACVMKQPLVLYSSTAAITANKKKFNCSIYGQLGQRMQLGIWQDNRFGPSETQDQWAHADNFFFSIEKRRWDETRLERRLSRLLQQICTLFRSHLYRRRKIYDRYTLCCNAALWGNTLQPAASTWFSPSASPRCGE